MSAERTCGPCHMCCRVFAIPEADKPHTGWCEKLEHGKGCRHYATRPAPCRDFLCGWRLDPDLGEEWRPDIAGFVLSDPEPWAFLVTCDSGRADAWRREPYHSHIRNWAREAGKRGLFAGVREHGTLSLIFKDREMPLNDDGRLTGPVDNE